MRCGWLHLITSVHCRVERRLDPGVHWTTPLVPCGSRLGRCLSRHSTSRSRRPLVKRTLQSAPRSIIANAVHRLTVHLMSLHCKASWSDSPQLVAGNNQSCTRVFAGRQSRPSRLASTPQMCSSSGCANSTRSCPISSWEARAATLTPSTTAATGAPRTQTHICTGGNMAVAHPTFS